MLIKILKCQSEMERETHLRYYMIDMVWVPTYLFGRSYITSMETTEFVEVLQVTDYCIRCHSREEEETMTNLRCHCPILAIKRWVHLNQSCLNYSLTWIPLMSKHSCFYYAAPNGSWTITTLFCIGIGWVPMFQIFVKL